VKGAIVVPRSEDGDIAAFARGRSGPPPVFPQSLAGVCLSDLTRPPGEAETE